MQTFQQPLGETQEAHYICMLKTGTEEEKERARQILIERNLRLVAHIVKNTRTWKKICRIFYPLEPLD